MTHRELKTEIVDLAAATRLQSRLDREVARETPPELSSDWRRWKQRSEWCQEFISKRLEELGDEAKRLYPMAGTSWSFRHRHIAASLMRGTPYHRIERPAPGNEPDWDAIEALIDEHSNDAKLTVVVARGLDPGQQAVQAAHAVAEWLLHALHRDRGIWGRWYNRRLVILEASKDLTDHRTNMYSERRDARKQGDYSKGEAVRFVESGSGALGGKETAFAALGEYECLSGLKLLQAKEQKEPAPTPEPSGYKEDEPKSGLLSRVFG